MKSTASAKPLNKIETCFAIKLAHCRSLSQCFDCLMAELSSFDIKHGMYAVGIGRTNNFPITYAVIANYPNDFMQEYAEKDMFLYDEGVQWAINQEKTLVWDEEIHEDYHLIETEQVDRFASKYGISYGFTVPLVNQHPELFSGLGLSVTGIDKHDFHQRILPCLPQIESLCSLFSRQIAAFNTYQEMKGRGKLQFPVLTMNEIEVLSCIARGMELRDIAALRKTGVDNINAFSKNIRRKLKSDNLPQAIYKACALRII